MSLSNDSAAPPVPLPPLPDEALVPLEAPDPDDAIEPDVAALAASIVDSSPASPPQAATSKHASEALEQVHPGFVIESPLHCVHPTGISPKRTARPRSWQLRAPSVMRLGARAAPAVVRRQEQSGSTTRCVLRWVVAVPRLLVPIASLALAACAGDESQPAPALPRCSDPLEIALADGSCVRPGIPRDGCAPGFVHDGQYGCDAILPPEPCPRGLMAVPGDGECRPVMPCGEGRWGDIVRDATTEHVDAAYQGGQSDGSEARPWTTIAEAVVAAAPGALVAVAAGSYVENVVVSFKPVRIEGVCPARVAITGTSQAIGICPAAALCIHSGADGTEVRGVSLGGEGIGVTLSGVEQVLIDKVHVRDCAWRGFDVEDFVGVTSLTVRGSLVEQNHDTGILLASSDARLEGSVVRSTLPRTADQSGGRGIEILGACALTPTGAVCDAARRASATIIGSLVEQNHEAGVVAVGSDLQVDATVVRSTLPRATDQKYGDGFHIHLGCSDSGAGLVCDPAVRANATVTGSLIERSHDVGLFVGGSDASVERTVVRDTLPSAADGLKGRGIGIQLACVATPMGLTCDPAARSSVTMTASLVEQSYDAGIFVAGSDAHLEGLVVRATVPRASDGLFGDGVAVVTVDAAGVATLSKSRIENSARAGVVSFGAQIALGSTHGQCNAFEIAAEPYEGRDPVFEDRGDNMCGCPGPDGPCQAVSAGLQPPEPLAQ